MLRRAGSVRRPVGAGALGVALVVAAFGCGARGGLDDAGYVGSGATTGGSGGAAPLEPAPCTASPTVSLYEHADDAYGAGMAYDAGTAGILFWSDTLMGPRTLRFARVDFAAPASITSWIDVTAFPVLQEAGIASMGGSFYAAWIEMGTSVHVGKLGMAALETNVTLSSVPSASAAALGVTEGGRLVAAWSTDDGGGSATVFAATSQDGVNFSLPSALSVTRGFALSIAPAPGGAVVAWSASVTDSSSLHRALVGEEGVPIAADVALTHHSRYVYDVSVRRGASGFVIATTDSRADIGNVPLYSTTLALDGTWGGVDTRLTFAGGHENLDLAYDAASFGLAYDEYNSPGTQIYLRQLDASGLDLFGAFQVSNATYLSSGCCTDTRYAHLATDAQGRFLVTWSEDTPRGGADSGYTLKAALLDCANRP